MPDSPSPNLCFTAVTAVLLFSGCTPAKAPHEHLPSLKHVQAPLSEEDSNELLGRMGGNWLYGNGVGETALAAGTVFVFPPYALYLLGNAALGLGGYEQMRLSDALPDQERSQWQGFYEGVTAAPGQVSAAIAGREFITREHAKERINGILLKPSNNRVVNEEK
jgi:hypothetical protein